MGMQKSVLGAALDVLPGGSAGLGTGDARQHQRHRPGRVGSHSRRDGHDHQRRHRPDADAGHQRSGYFEAPLLQAGTVSRHVDMAELQDADPERHQLSVGQSLSLKLTLEVGSDLRARRRHGQGAAPRHDVGVLGTELRSGADRRSADGVEHADPAREIRAGRRQPDDAGAGDLGADRRSDQRRRHRARRRRQLQLHDRRRHQRRQQPPHRQRRPTPT